MLHEVIARFIGLLSWVNWLRWFGFGQLLLCRHRGHEIIEVGSLIEFWFEWVRNETSWAKPRTQSSTWWILPNAFIRSLPLVISMWKGEAISIGFLDQPPMPSTSHIFTFSLCNLFHGCWVALHGPFWVGAGISIWIYSWFWGCLPVYRIIHPSF